MMDRTLGNPSLRLAGVGPLVLGVAAGLLLAALTPAASSLTAPGVLVVAFFLAAFTGLALTSSA